MKRFGMAVFHLDQRPIFPSAQLADKDGLLAFGGDLSSRRLLAAYRMGIFPWYDQGSVILWWSPDPRGVIFPGKVHVPRRLSRIIRQGRFSVSADTCFEEVIAGCAHNPLKGRQSSWITDEMQDAYIRLHRQGFAHSIECRRDGELVGGLYGVSLGRLFFGESMFSLCPDTSKVALIHLCRRLQEWGFDLLDCQLPSAHLAGLGAEEMSRDAYLSQLKDSLQHPDRTGPWTQSFDDSPP